MGNVESEKISMKKKAKVSSEDEREGNEVLKKTGETAVVGIRGDRGLGNGIMRGVEHWTPWWLKAIRLGSFSSNIQPFLYAIDQF